MQPIVIEENKFFTLRGPSRNAWFSIIATASQLRKTAHELAADGGSLPNQEQPISEWHRLGHKEPCFGSMAVQVMDGPLASLPRLETVEARLIRDENGKACLEYRAEGDDEFRPISCVRKLTLLRSLSLIKAGMTKEEILKFKLS